MMEGASCTPPNGVPSSRLFFRFSFGFFCFVCRIDCKTFPFDPTGARFCFSPWWNSPITIPPSTLELVGVYHRLHRLAGPSEAVVRRMDVTSREALDRLVCCIRLSAQPARRMSADASPECHAKNYSYLLLRQFPPTGYDLGRSATGRRPQRLPNRR